MIDEENEKVGFRPDDRVALADGIKSFVEAVEAGTKAQNLGTEMIRKVFMMLICVSIIVTGLGAYSEYRATKRDQRQDMLAEQIGAIADQVSSVQRTADSTQTSVAVIEDRPSLDLEIVDARPSASAGAIPTAAVVIIRKPRPSEPGLPSASVTIPLSLPSVSAQPEPKK